MKRCLLILAVFLMIVLFSMYILDLKFNGVFPPPFTCLSRECNPDTGALMPCDAMIDDEADSTITGQAADGDWELIWRDEFDGSLLDSKIWTAVERKDNYNSELQYYSPDNVSLMNGYLYLTARREYQEDKAYTSAMVQTADKLSLCCGKIETRMKLPAGQGLFPALWLLSSTGRSEIDIMEMIGSEPELIYGVNHFQAEGRPAKTVGLIEIDSPGNFHVYALEWEEDELRWFVDGVMFHQCSIVPVEEMYIILTLAVGGNWPGTPGSDTPFPSDLVVDYINLYRHR